MSRARPKASRAETVTPYREIQFEGWDDFHGRFLRSYAAQSRRRRDSLLFRGQPEAGWEITTTLDRFQRFDSDFSRDATYEALLGEFRREAILMGSRLDSAREFEALELLARHHGLPSPLLDCTESPYIAAYFAFEGADPSRGGQVAIWALDCAAFDFEASPIDLIDDVELIRFNQRALRQAGKFLKVRTVARSVGAILGTSLTKLILPAESRALALADLDEMTINATYLFADLDGAARTARVRLA